MSGQKVAQALPEDKLELFRNEMMAPFRKQWEVQQIPFKAEEEHGFDVITFNSMMHRSPDQITRVFQLKSSGFHPNLFGQSVSMLYGKV